MSKIKVLTKQPGKMAVLTYVSDELHNLQKYVGGYIEMFPVAKDVVVICNEEGKIKGMDYNFTMCGENFVGPVIIAGVNGEELTDLNYDIAVLKTVMPQLWDEGVNDLLRDEYKKIQEVI